MKPSMKELSIIFAVLILPASGLIWMGVCNELTYADRRALLDAISDEAMAAISRGENPMPPWQEYKKTSYGTHLFRRMTFQNTCAAYETAIQRLCK